MARDYLAASGTGVPIERTFCLGTELLTSERHQLSAEAVRSCMSLKCWLKFKSPEEFLKQAGAEVIKKMTGEV